MVSFTIISLIFRFRILIEKMFGFTYLFEFSNNVIGLCTTTYVLTMVTDKAAWFFMFSLLLAETQILFVPCYCGSMLFFESNLSLSSIYKSNWSVGSKAFKLSMLIFGERVKHPAELRSMGGVYTISLPTFVGVCNFSVRFLVNIS